MYIDCVFTIESVFRELMAWATEFLARMSAPELSENLQDAVTIHSRHRYVPDTLGPLLPLYGLHAPRMDSTVIGQSQRF